MIYYNNQAVLKIPNYPNTTNILSLDNIWVSSKNSMYYYLWGDRYVASVYIGHTYKIGNNIFIPRYESINGYVYFSGDGYLYMTSGNGWVISNYFPGYEPREYYDKDTGERKGDAFYSGSLPASRDGASSVFVPRGCLLENSETITLEYVFNGWRKEEDLTNPCGVYINAIDRSRRIYFGSPRWKDQNGKEYIKSITGKIYFGDEYFSYGDIHYYRTNHSYIIGTYGDPAGWYQGPAPSLLQPVTFEFKRNWNSDAQAENLVITHFDYVMASERKQAFLGDLAIWR